MEFLEVLTEGLERVLMVRGGGREVITIYSWRHFKISLPHPHHYVLHTYCAASCLLTCTWHKLVPCLESSRFCSILQVWVSHSDVTEGCFSGIWQCFCGWLYRPLMQLCLHILSCFMAIYVKHELVLCKLLKILNLFLYLDTERFICFTNRPTVKPA